VSRRAASCALFGWVVAFAFAGVGAAQGAPVLTLVIGNDPDGSQVFAEDLTSLWAERNSPTPERLARTRDRATRQYQLALENLARVHAAGIPVVMGTDAGNPLTLHGASVFMELEAMEAAGLSPMDVLVAATRVGARALGLDSVGTVTPGSALLPNLVIFPQSAPPNDAYQPRRAQRAVG